MNDSFFKKSTKIALIVIFLFSLKVTYSGFSVLAQSLPVDTILYNGDPDKFINLVFLGDGYQNTELEDFLMDVENTTNAIFAAPPFKEYKSYFNVFAISAASTHSGASHPRTAVCPSASEHPYKNAYTTYACGFDSYGTHRLLWPKNFTAINSHIIENFPLYDQILMIVNTPYRGGGGGTIATGSMHPSASETMLHEMGHSFAGLADEYWSGTNAAEKPNMTQTGNPLTVKWNKWIGYEGVGVYSYYVEGAWGSQYWKRPHNSCKMRITGPNHPFCPVCKEAIVEEIHLRFGNPVISHTPNDTIIPYCAEPLSFELSLIVPVPNTLKVVWSLNGAPIENNQALVIIESSDLNVGENSLSVQVVDTTAFVRDSLHMVDQTYQIDWIINHQNFTAFDVSIEPDGAISFCEGDSLMLTASNAESYLWNNNSTSNSITVESTGEYYVTAMDENGCSAVSEPIEVNVNPDVSITHSDTTTFCLGGEVILTASEASTYLWSTGDTGQNITVNSSGLYDVTVTDSDGCSGTSSPILISVISPPVADISSSTAISYCEGDTLTLTAGMGNNYLWNDSSNTPSIYVTEPGNYWVIVNNLCGIDTSEIVAVSVHERPIPAIEASGPTTFCQGDEVMLSTDSAAAYLWSNGATSREISVSEAGAYTVTVTDSNGCSGTSVVQEIMLEFPPNATLTHDGPVTFCQGDNISLSASDGSSYLWNTGELSQSVTVSESGDYFVIVNNNCGTDTSEVLTIAVESFPYAAIVTNTGFTNFCQGDELELSVNSDGSYLWNNGAETQSISVSESGIFSVAVSNSCGTINSSPLTVTAETFPAASINASDTLIFCEGDSLMLIANGGFTYAWNTEETTQVIFASHSGDYYVIATNSCGVDTSSVVEVTVKEMPIALISPSGDSSPLGVLSICEGSDIMLTASDASAFLWSNGTETQSITVSEPGDYFVTITGENDCSATSAIETITITTVNTSVSIYDNILLANASDVSYQWFTCSGFYDPIDSATNQLFTAVENESYAVQITHNGCSEFSECITVTTVNTRSLDNSADLTVYPNPTSNFLTVRGTGLDEGLYTLALLSPSGQHLRQKQFNVNGVTTELQFNMQEFAAGSYLLIVRSKGFFRVFNIQKQ